jgi:hypothetical protein
MRPRTIASLDDAADPRFHDDLVTPGSTPDRLGWPYESIERADRS